jgi:hypothetical protein
VEVNGYPIEQYPFPRSRLRVKTPDAFDWEEARISAGFTRAEFESLPGDPGWISINDNIKMSKADVIMSHHYRRLLNMVQEIEAYKKK